MRDLIDRVIFRVGVISAAVGCDVVGFKLFQWLLRRGKLLEMSGRCQRCGEKIGKWFLAEEFIKRPVWECPFCGWEQMGDHEQNKTG